MASLSSSPFRVVLSKIKSVQIHEQDFLLLLQCQKPLMHLNLFIQIYEDPSILPLMVLNILLYLLMISLKLLGCIC
jgi:hypothetical protein